MIVCQTCERETNMVRLSAAGQYFCSDVCHLRFWKDNMPNLGGKWITDRNIAKVGSLEGEERKEEYNRITGFILKNMSDTVIFSRLRRKMQSEDDDA